MCNLRRVRVLQVLSCVDKPTHSPLTPFVMLVHLLLGAVVIPGTSASWFSAFTDRLSSISYAHNLLFHERLLEQLRSSRVAATSAVASQPDVTSVASAFDFSNLATSPDNSTGSYADNSTDSFVLYTSDALPTNPAPPTACADALTATIDCNSTVPLMRRVLAPVVPEYWN